MVKQTKIKRKNLYLLCTKPLGSILVKRFTFRYVIFQSCWYNKNICQNKDICYKKNIASIRIVAQLGYLLQKRDCYNKDITTIKIFATIRILLETEYCYNKDIATTKLYLLYTKPLGSISVTESLHSNM